MDEREKSFATEYIINKGNAYQAALAAGYAKYTAKNAYEWLVETLSDPTKKRHLPFKPHLKVYIEEQLKKIQSEKTATAQEVVEYLTSVLRGKSKSEVIVVEGEGDGCSSARIVLKGPDEKERLKAAELLGKILGVFNDRLNLNGGISITFVEDIGDVDE